MIELCMIAALIALILVGQPVLAVAVAVLFCALYFWI